MCIRDSCYEDILPDFSYDLIQKRPELLVNLTNDGWFGQTAEPATHLALAQARAIEARVYMVRATCTGISAFIDPLGRTVQVSERDQVQALAQEISWMPGGSLFGAIGSSFSWACVVLSILWLCGFAKRTHLGTDKTL